MAYATYACEGRPKKGRHQRQFNEKTCRAASNPSGGISIVVLPSPATLTSPGSKEAYSHRIGIHAPAET